MSPAEGTRPRHRRFIASARTNLPIWPATPPSIDETGRGFIAIGLGEDASCVVNGWQAAIAALERPYRMHVDPAVPLSEDLAHWFDDALRVAVVGWRLMLAGPASEVLVLMARARAAGMLEAEIRAFALADGFLRGQCVHCRTTFRAEGGPGSVLRCPGCGRTLLVHQHLSRRHAAFVSFVDDVEKPR